MFKIGDKIRVKRGAGTYFDGEEGTITAEGFTNKHWSVQHEHGVCARVYHETQLEKAGAAVQFNGQFTRERQFIFDNADAAVPKLEYFKNKRVRITIEEIVE